MFSWRSTLTPMFSSRAAVSLSHHFFPTLYWRQELPTLSAGSPLELRTTTASLPVPGEPAKGTLLMVSHKKPQIVRSSLISTSEKYCKSSKGWANICITFPSFYLPALSARERVEKLLGLFFSKLKYPILFPCSRWSLSVYVVMTHTSPSSYPRWCTTEKG